MWCTSNSRSRACAAGFVALMLTTEVLIADIKEDNEIAAVGAGQSGGMGGMY